MTLTLLKRRMKTPGSKASASRSAKPRWWARTESGQGTTEYAILVGVLVVIAIIAIIALRPYIQDLWDSIVEGVGKLSG